MLVVLIRTIVIYVFIVMAIRLMGKRQLGELQPNELVVTIIISNIATLSLQDSDMPLLGTLLPIFLLVSCEVLVSYLALKSYRVRRMVSGNPMMVIRDGKIDQHAMQQLRWTVDDLMAQLRVNNVFDLSEVALAVVETSGSLSVYQNFESRPLTAGTMNLPVPQDQDQSPPILIVSDGYVLDTGLRYCGIDRNWLNKTLSQNGVTLGDTFLMTCDRKQNYQLIRRDKR